MGFDSNYRFTEVQSHDKIARLRAEAEQARLLPRVSWRFRAAASLRRLADRLEPARNLGAPSTYPHALEHYTRGEA